MKNLSFREKYLFVPALIIGFCMMFPSISFAQTTSSATNTIGYFYAASGQMIDAESNTGAISSYLTRGERNDGASETFAVSNIKDITADLDSNGNIINKYTYSAYGTQTSYTSNTQISESTNSQLSLSSNPFTYDGYYTDSESGNYYLNARYYDPTLGIFLTSDSYNLPNRYMYVNGNPVMGLDPNGHNFEEILKKYFTKFVEKHLQEENDKKYMSIANEVVEKANKIADMSQYPDGKPKTDLYEKIIGSYNRKAFNYKNIENIRNEQGLDCIGISNISFHILHDIVQKSGEKIFANTVHMWSSDDWDDQWGHVHQVLVFTPNPEGADSTFYSNFTNLKQKNVYFVDSMGDYLNRKGVFFRGDDYLGKLKKYNIYRSFTGIPTLDILNVNGNETFRPNEVTLSDLLGA